MKTLKRLFVGLMILVGCITLTMNASAERHQVMRTPFADDFGNVLFWVDRNLDGKCDEVRIYLYYPDTKEYVLYGITTPEIGEQIRKDAIEIDRRAKLKQEMKGAI